MTSLDFRTRFEGDETALQPVPFVQDQIPALLAEHGDDAGHAASSLGLAPLSLAVDDEWVTFSVGADGCLVVRQSRADDLVVALGQEGFSDLMQDTASTFGLQMTGRAEVRRGAVDDFVAWEPVLRCLLDGRPVYEPGTIEFRDASGRALHLRRTFTLDDDPDDIGHFLSETGFVHIQGMFNEAEMAAVSAELDDAVEQAERDDGASWWARTKAGGWYAARVLGFNEKSPTLRELIKTEPFMAIGHFTEDTFVQRDPDVGDSAEGLLKRIDVVEGISDVSWHKDCSMGGHSRRCCGLTVGISVTGAGPENGELGAVAGSHRANVAPLGIEGVELPRVPLPTRTGDITVHCSCTLHMSRPPVSAERRVVYTGFDLAPRPGDRRAASDPAELRRQRAALNDHVRQRQEDGPLTRMASHEL